MCDALTNRSAVPPEGSALNVTDTVAIKEIVRRMPSFAKVFKDPRSLRDYSVGVPYYTPSITHAMRQIPLRRILAEYMDDIFGVSESTISTSSTDDLGLVCNIVDHQKLMSNPVQLSVPIVSHLDNILREKKSDIVGFSTAAVGLEEPFNRRSILLGGHRVNLYPARRRNDVVHWAPLQSFDLVARAFETKVWYRLSPAQRQLLERTQALVAGLDFGGCRGLSDQLTLINATLWPHLFESGMRDNLARLVQLDFEEVGRRYLLHLLEHEPEAFPLGFLFDPRRRTRALAAFDGLVGAWDGARGRGSHFFWANRAGHRTPLLVIDNALVRPDTGERTQIDPASVFGKLQDRSWMPGQILLFAAIIFYAGVKPIMGWSLEFVTRLAASLAEQLSGDDEDEVRHIRSLPLDNMNLFSVLGDSSTRTGDTEQSAFDVIEQGGISRDRLQDIGNRPLSYYLRTITQSTLNYARDKFPE